MGRGYIEDTLCGVPVQLGPLSFYQVNTLAAEQLYGIAAQYAQLTPDDLLLDLYCGMGTHRYSPLADRCRELIGVEIVPEAIDSAKGPTRPGWATLSPAKSRFFCARRRSGCGPASPLRACVLMSSCSTYPARAATRRPFPPYVQMSPRRVVYVSCNPSTAARDAAWLEEHGYHAEKVQPVDLFPRTRHCETVVLLSKGEVDSKKIRVEFSLEDMDMSEFQDGATYPQIKEYVLEHTGLKVSNLYISQIKRKCRD
mgnify:CR=1 FL=1